MNLALVVAGLGAALVLSTLAGLITVRAHPGHWISERDYGETPILARVLIFLSVGGGWLLLKASFADQGHSPAVVIPLSGVAGVVVAAAAIGPLWLIRRRHNTAVGPDPEPAGDAPLEDTSLD
jgi:hypothetical protein